MTEKVREKSIEILIKHRYRTFTALTANGSGLSLIYNKRKYALRFNLYICLYMYFYFPHRFLDVRAAKYMHEFKCSTGPAGESIP